jgi:dihydrofolate reductase
MASPHSEIKNHKSKISLIVAMSENRVIGRQGRLPWRLPDDLKRFKELTTGHTVIMGRKTFESIGRPLPQRRNIVASRNPDWAAEGVEIAHSLDEALVRTAGEAEVFIIGGEQLYRAALPRADRIYLTRVLACIEGDAFFPSFQNTQWTLAQRLEHPADERHEYAMTFEAYERCG